jgi:hypothetical protein
MITPSQEKIRRALRALRNDGNPWPWRDLLNQYTEWAENGHAADVAADDSLEYA